MNIITRRAQKGNEIRNKMMSLEKVMSFKQKTKTVSLKKGNDLKKRDDEPRKRC